MPNPEEAREQAYRAWLDEPLPGGSGFWFAWNARGQYDEQRIAALMDGLERAMQLLAYGNFKSGNTDPTGTLDEGEVLAGRMYDELRALAGQEWAERGG